MVSALPAMSDESSALASDSFASLFEAGPSVGRKSVRVGQTLEATIVALGKDNCFVALDGKRQAYIASIELRDEQGEFTVKEGDTLVAKVIAVDSASGDVRLGKSFGRATSVAQFEEARNARIAVQGKVSGVNKGGIEVDLGGGARGFCPNSQTGPKGLDPNTLVGQELSFLVTEIKEGGKSIVLSRRALIQEEAREAKARVLANLEIGKTVKGTVTAIRDFGAFVDIGGLEALIPASEMSYERRPVNEILTAGDSVEAQVLAVKEDEKGNPKVSLSLKALLPVPEGFTPPAARSANAPVKFTIHQVVEGAVVRVETYGLFVQVDGTDGRQGRGLVPAGETGTQRGPDLKKLFPEGTKVTCSVMETGDGKLKLSIRGAKNAAERADYESHKGQMAQKGFGTLADLLSKVKVKK